MIKFEDTYFSSEFNKWNAHFQNANVDKFKLQLRLNYAKQTAENFLFGQDYIGENIEEFEFLGNESTTNFTIIRYFIFKRLKTFILILIFIAIAIILSGILIIIGIFLIIRKFFKKKPSKVIDELALV